MIRYLKQQAGVIFGLDARIVLVVLALVSISIALVDEKVSSKEKDFIIKQKLRAYKADILKNLEELRIKGYDAANYSFASLAVNPSSYDGLEKYLYPYDGTANYYNVSVNTATSTYLRTLLNGESYTSGLNKCSTRMLRSYLTATDFYDNYITAEYEAGTGNYQNYQAIDICYRIQKSLEVLQFERSSKDIISSDTVTDGVDNHVQLGRDEYGTPIQVRILVEHNISKFNKSDYIIHFILYSYGANGVLDTSVPTNLEQLDNFQSEAKGDDIFEVFSTKNIYIKAKLENNQRLEEISEKINSRANSLYMQLLSTCANDFTLDAKCDLNTDNSHTAVDVNLINEMNFYYKSNLDTSSATYHDSSETYDYTLATTSARDFVYSSLGLPAFYYIDLYGNMLGYNSNINNLDTGPFTMEVWY